MDKPQQSKTKRENGSSWPDLLTYGSRETAKELDLGIEIVGASRRDNFILKTSSVGAVMSIATE